MIFGWIMLVMLVVEFVLAWRTLGLFIADKTARFSVEYGEVDGSAEEHSARARAQRTEVLALDNYINEGLDDDDDGNGNGNGNDDGLLYDGDFNDDDYTLASSSARGGGGSSRRSARDRNSARQPLSPLREEVELIAPRRRGNNGGGDGVNGNVNVRASFGGPSVVPYNIAAKSASAPRGSAAPPSAAATSTFSSSANFNFGGSSSSSSSGVLAQTSTMQREMETVEERARRRARDRAIIEGRLVPERRGRDDNDMALESAAHLELARAHAAATAQIQADRLATSRPTMASLTSPANVRIPLRSELHGTPAERQSLKSD